MPANKNNQTISPRSVDQQYYVGGISVRIHHIPKSPIDSLSATKNSTSNPPLMKLETSIQAICTSATDINAWSQYLSMLNGPDNDHL